MTMLRCVLRSKIHMATVTESNLAYEGSITIDAAIMKRAGILPYEQVMVSNLNNGARFQTYVIPAPENSGQICLNGPTARKGVVGDVVIVFCYVYLDDEKAAHHKPTIIFLDSRNAVKNEK